MKLIAEIGQAHDGSHGNLLAMVQRLCTLRVDIVKVQHHIADAESSEHEQFRKKFSVQDATRQDYWRRMEIPLPLMREIKGMVEAAGKQFLCTPFSMRAVDELESIGVDSYKVGSADVGNRLLLRRIAETKKPVIISSGTKDVAAMDAAIELLRPAAASLTVMHCTSAYPTPLRSVDLLGLDRLRTRYGLPVGLSDHSGQIWPTIFALAHGATHAEVHFTWSRDQFGPDTTSSLTPTEFETIADAIAAWSDTHVADGDPGIAAELERVRTVFTRSVRLRRPLSAGETLSLAHLECFKPAGVGVDTQRAEALLGLVACVPLGSGTVLTDAVARVAFDA
jgi:N,N'-diacetyllegionaminate synthase